MDENGVSHYSQNAPPGDVPGVSTMILEDTTPPDYDPEEDRYGVAAQAERMAALREEMAEKREAQRERQRNAPQQPVVQYQQPYQYGIFTVFGDRPITPVRHCGRSHPSRRPQRFPSDRLA